MALTWWARVTEVSRRVGKAGPSAWRRKKAIVPRSSSTALAPQGARRDSPHVKSFADLKLSSKSLHALEKAGFEHPTPIQVQAIPPALAGQDVIGGRDRHRQDGRLPPAHPGAARREDRHARPRARPHPRAGGPDRGGAQRFGKGRDVRARRRHRWRRDRPADDGLPRARQVVDRDARPPRRSPEQGTARSTRSRSWSSTRPTGCSTWASSRQLDRILARLPKVRQTLLFSATMAGRGRRLRAAHLRDPVRVEVARSGTTAARAEQRVYLVRARAEAAAPARAARRATNLSTLVFTRTKRRADRVAREPRARRPCGDAHPRRPLAGPAHAALDGFKDGKLPRPRRDRHRRPRHRRGRDRPRGELRPAARRPRTTSTASAGPPATRRAAEPPASPRPRSSTS